MVLSEKDYLAQLQALLPPGPAWSTDTNDYLTKVLSALSIEFARIDGRIANLLDEADPRFTSELILDWERVAGLPDACAEAFGGEQTSSQRRAALLGRLTTLGGQSIAQYVALASAIGYAITVTEFESQDVNDDVEMPVYGAAWDAAWQVNTALNTVTTIDVESNVEEPLSAWGNALLECVINRLKPAHTTVLFGYV